MAQLKKKRSQLIQIMFNPARQSQSWIKDKSDSEKTSHFKRVSHEQAVILQKVFCPRNRQKVAEHFPGRSLRTDLCLKMRASVSKSKQSLKKT